MQAKPMFLERPIRNPETQWLGRGGSIDDKVRYLNRLTAAYRVGDYRALPGLHDPGRRTVPALFSNPPCTQAIKPQLAHYSGTEGFYMDKVRVLAPQPNPTKPKPRGRYIYMIERLVISDTVDADGTSNWIGGRNYTRQELRDLVTWFYLKHPTLKPKCDLPKLATLRRMWRG
jgi:hypothetical protein